VREVRMPGETQMPALHPYRREGVPQPGLEQHEELEKKVAQEDEEWTPVRAPEDEARTPPPPPQPSSLSEQVAIVSLVVV
jgi:hypothetical protein